MYLLGYDIGSSSVKASLVNAENGKCVSSAFFPKTEAAIIAGAGAYLSGVDKSNNSAELNKNYVAITGSTFNNTDGRMLLIIGAESKIDRSKSTVTATFKDNYVTINNSKIEGKDYFITGAYNRLQYVGSSTDTRRSKAELTGNYVTIDGTNGGKSIISITTIIITIFIRFRDPSSFTLW